MLKHLEEKNTSEEMSSLVIKSELIKLVLQVVVGLSLLTGGIVLLALRIPGWSIIFGLPMVVISSVFVIYTYDDILNKNLKQEMPPREDGEP